MADGKDSSATAARRQRSASERNHEDIGGALIQLSPRDWSACSSEERDAFLKDTDESYRVFLDEFFNSANRSVEQYQKFSESHLGWRRRVIVGTGCVAMINMLAAFKIAWTEAWLPIMAAVCAVVLSILANLESLYDCAGRTQAYRESRELFLDAGREYNRLWDAYVRPFGNGPEACANASELYRRIVAKDRELRTKLKELTKTEKKKG